MPVIHLDAAVPSAGVLLCALCAGLFAFWQYRRTIPSLSPTRRIILTALRSAALFSILLLLLEPSLRITTSSTKLPKLAIFVDNSASMQIRDSGALRSATVDSLLRSPALTPLAERMDLQYYSVGVVVRPFNPVSGDTLGFSEEATDLASAMRRLGRMHVADGLDAAVLISDGTYTLGSNPVYDAEQTAIPLYTVAVGDSTPQKDLVLSRILTNTTAYSGVESPVDIRVRSTGFSGERIEIILRNGPTVLSRSFLPLEQGTREYSVPLSFTPRNEGAVRLTAEILPLPGELTTANNHLAISVRVLKSKIRILILAGSAGPDIPAVRQPLVEQGNFSVEVFTQKGDGSYFEGTLTRSAIDSADCLVLIGFPQPSVSPQHLEWLAQKLQTPSPILYIAGRHTAYDLLRRLQASLPFIVDLPSVTEQLVTAHPIEAYQTHPLLTLDRENPLSVWTRLPPLYQTLTVFHPTPDATVLAEADREGASTAAPFLISRDAAGRREIALLGYGLYRWRLMTHGDPLTSGLWTDFLSTAVRWLTAPPDIRRLRVRPAKDLFVRGEPVTFIAEAYDETLRPFDEARISLQITGGSRPVEIELRPEGSGRYEGSVDFLDHGDYSYTAKAEVDRKTIGRESGSFRVGEPSVEFRETRSSPAVLRALAERTGGAFLQPAQFLLLDSIISANPLFAPQTVQRSRIIDLWAWPGLLALVVLLLAAEWVLRRRGGLL